MMSCVKDVMRPETLSIEPSATLEVAAARMIELDVDILLVVEGERLIGAIRLAELLRVALPLLAQRDRLAERRDLTQLRPNWKRLQVKHIMKKQTIAVDDATPIMWALALAINYNRQRLPVVRAGRLVGTVDRLELVRQLLLAQTD